MKKYPASISTLIEGPFHFSFMQLPVACQTKEFFVLGTIGNFLIMTAILTEAVNYQLIVQYIDRRA